MMMHVSGCPVETTSSSDACVRRGYIVADGQTEAVLLLKSKKLFAFAEGIPHSSNAAAEQTVRYYGFTPQIGYGSWRVVVDLLATLTSQ